MVTQFGHLQERCADFSKGTRMAFLLWIIAVVLVVAGIGALLRRAYLYGALLIIVGLLIGPGGVSVFT